MNSQTQSVQSLDRHLKALELRKAGVSYRHIAEQLGYRGVSGAHSAVARALKKAIQEPAAEVLKLELERLDALLLALWSDAKRGNYGAIDRTLKIMERRSKLLGLDIVTTTTQNLNIDMSTLTIAQVERIAHGEDPIGVLATPGVGGAGTSAPTGD